MAFNSIAEPPVVFRRLALGEGDLEGRGGCAKDTLGLLALAAFYNILWSDTKRGR